MSELIGTLDWDSSKAEATSAKVRNEAEAAQQMVELVEQKANVSFMKLIGTTHQVFGIMDKLFQVAGVNIGAQLRMAISSGFEIVRVLSALYNTMLAADPTGIMRAQAIMGLIGLGVSMAAIGAAQQEEAEIAERLSSLSGGISGVNNLLSSFNIA